VPLWFGADGAGLFYLGLVAFYAGVYLWVGSQASRSVRTWRIGTLAGLGIGGIGLAVSLVTDWFPALDLLRPLSWLALLGLPLFVGALGARAGGRASDGALAGFWCGIAAALLLALSIMLVDNTFTTTFLHTSWAHDPTCPYPAGSALAGC